MIINPTSVEDTESMDDEASLSPSLEIDDDPSSCFVLSDDHVLSYRSFQVRMNPEDVKDKVFLAIVKALLKMGNRPCTPKELSECIQKHKFAALGGNTPYATVSSRISQHFKRVAESRPHPRPALLGKQNVSSLRKLGYFVNQKGVSVDFQIATSKPHTSESDDSSDVPVDELQPTEQPPAIANPVMADSARVHTAPSALAPASSAISAVHTISTPSIERRPNLAGALAFSPSTDSPDSSGKLPAKNGVTRPFRVNGALKDAARAATKRKRIATGMQEDPLEPVRSSKPASARKRASVAPVVDEPHKPPDCGAESDEEIDIMSVDDDVLSTTSAIPSSNAGDAQATPTGSRQIAPRVPTSQPNPFDDAAPSDQPPILGISLSDSVSGEAAASGSNSTQSEMDLQLRKNDQQCPPNASSPKHAVLVSSLSSADLGSKSEASNVDPGCISAATPQPSTAGITVPSASATLSSVLFPQAPNFNGYIPDPATSTSDRTAPSINRATLRYASSHEAIFMPNMMSPETHRPPTFSDRSPNLAQLPHHGSRSQSNINKGWHMGDPDLYLPSPIGDDASIFGLDEGLRLDLGSSSRHSGGPHSLSSKFVPFVAPIDASYGSVRTASGIQRKRKDSYESGLQMFQRHTSTASLELFESSHKAAKRFKVNPQQHTIKLGDFILRRSFLEAPNGLVEMVVASPLTELPIFTLPWSPRPPILPASAPHFEIFWNHDSSPVQIVQCLVQLTGMVKLRDILLRRIRTTGEEKLLEMRSPAHMDSLSTLAILDAANPALVPPLTAIDLRDRVCWSRYLELLIWLVRESASTTKTLQISGSLVSLDQSFAFDPFGMLAFEGLGPALGAEVDGLHNHLIVWLHGLPGYTSFKDMSLEGIWVSSECAQRLTEEFDLLPVTSEAISLICEGFQTPQAAQSSSLSGDVRAASAPVTGGIDAMAEDEGNAFFVFSEGESEASDDTPDTPMLPAQASSSLLEATSTARPASDPSSGSTAESTSGPSSAAGSVATRLSATEPSLQHESGPAALGPASETTTLGRVRTELLASPFTSGRDELLSETSVLHSRTRQHCPVHLSPSTLDLFPAVENPLHPPTNVWMVEIEGLLCYVTWIPETHRLLSGAGRLGSESMLREGDGREPPTRSPRMQAQSQNITDAALAGASTLQSPRLRGEGETGIPILRRVDNGMVNATLLLYAGGMRTEEERSIALSLEQSKVRCRKADSQLYGTWIPLGRARELARSCCLEAKLSTILGDEIGKIAFRRALSPDSILLPPSVTDLDPPGVNTLGQDCSADCPMLESTTGAEGSPVAQEAGLIQPELRTSSGVGSAAGASVISTASSSGVSPGAEVTLPHISTTPVPNTAQSVPPAVTADKALPAVATAAPSVATVPSRSISVSASASLVGNKPPSLARTSPAKALAPPMSLDGTGPSPAIKSTAAAVVPAALPQSNANEPQRRPGNDGRDALASAVDEPRTAEVVSIPSSASKALSLSATTAVPPSTTLSTTPSTAALTTATAAGLRPPLLTISPRAPSRPTLPTPAPSGAAASTPSTPTITGGAALPPASPAISSLTAAKGTPSTSQPSNTHTLAAAGAAPASQSAPATAAAGTRKPKSRYTAAKKDGPKPGSVAKTTGEPLPGLVRNRVSEPPQATPSPPPPPPAAAAQMQANATNAAINALASKLTAMIGPPSTWTTASITNALATLTTNSGLAKSPGLSVLSQTGQGGQGVSLTAAQASSPNVAGSVGGQSGILGNVKGPGVSSSSSAGSVGSSSCPDTLRPQLPPANTAPMAVSKSTLVQSQVAGTPTTPVHGSINGKMTTVGKQTQPPLPLVSSASQQQTALLADNQPTPSTIASRVSSMPPTPASAGCSTAPTGSVHRSVAAAAATAATPSTAAPIVTSVPISVPASAPASAPMSIARPPAISATASASMPVRSHAPLSAAPGPLAHAAPAASGASRSAAEAMNASAGASKPVASATISSTAASSSAVQLAAMLPTVTTSSAASSVPATSLALHPSPISTLPMSSAPMLSSAIASEATKTVINTLFGSALSVTSMSSANMAQHAALSTPPPARPISQNTAMRNPASVAPANTPGVSTQFSSGATAMGTSSVPNTQSAANVVITPAVTRPGATSSGSQSTPQGIAMGTTASMPPLGLPVGTPNAATILAALAAMTKNAANNWKPMGPSISTEDINRSILAAAASVSPYSGQFSATLAAAVARASAQAQANAFQMLMAQAQLQQLQASVELQALVQAEQKRRDSEKVLQNLSTQMSGVSASHSEEKGKPGMTSHDLAPRPQLAAQPSADAVVAAQVNGPVQLDSRSGPLLGTGKTPSGHASGHEIVPAQSKPHNGVTPPTGDVAAVHPQVSDTGPSIVAPTPAPIPAPTPAPTPVPGGGIDINSLTQLTALAAKTPGFGANLLGLGLPLLMQSSGQLSSNISKVLSQLQAQARQPTFPAPGSSTSRDMGLSGPAESAVNQAGGRGQPHPDPSETSNTKTEAGGGAHPAPAGPDSVSETLGRRLRRQVPAKIKDEADVSVTAAAASAPLRRSLRSEPGPLPTVLSSPLGTSMPSGSRSSAAKNPQGAVRRASRSAVSVRVEGERNAGEMDVDVAADDALGKQR